MGRTDPQVNVRLSPEQGAILDAAAFVHNDTPGHLARDAVCAAIERYAALPTVKKALEARAEQVAASEGKLTHLSQAPGRSVARPRGKSSP